MKNNYYVEFLFETEDKKNRYLFPVFVESYTIDGALELVAKTRLALSEKFIFISNTYPKVIIPNFNQQYFQERYETRLIGKCVQLDVQQWIFNNYNPDITLSFEENMKLVPFEDYDDSELIVSLLSSQQFPVRVVKDDDPFGFNNCLAIDVVF